MQDDALHAFKWLATSASHVYCDIFTRSPACNLSDSRVEAEAPGKENTPHAVFKSRESMRRAGVHVKERDNCMRCP